MKSNLLYIGNKLSQHGLTVTPIETLGNLLESEGYHLIYASSKKHKTLRLLDMLYTTVKHRKNIDYVLIDTYSTKNFWYTFFVSQLCRVLNLKYIPALHGGDLPNRLKKTPRLCNLVFKNAYINIAPSNYLLEAFSNRGFATLAYIPNSIQLQNYPFKSRETIAPKLLWVRSFSWIYNPEMAVKVFQELKKDYPQAALCMVGPDKDGTLEKVKQFAKENDLNVNFTGKLSKEDWISLSKDYDVFMNTTHFDNTPVSVIEAMALGLPIVSTNVGGIGYLLTHHKTALLVEDNDVEGMTKAIKEMIANDSLRHELTQNAYALVKEFDWDKVKNKWTEVLK